MYSYYLNLTDTTLELMRFPLITLTLPDDLLDTARRVVTPSVVLPATESTSIQKDTHEMTTIKIVGMYDWTMWKPRDLFRYNSAKRQL